MPFGPDRPCFWIVGGPNGSGKSTLIRSGALTPWIGFALQALSPDDVVLELRPRRPNLAEADLLLEAQLLSDAAVDRALGERKSVLVETVLSSPKFQSRVETAVRNGFEFGFAFVTVRSPELNVNRVRDRVIVGGHDVPEDRIRARRERSHRAATWFAERAHVGVVFDNSGMEPMLLAKKPRGAPGWEVLNASAVEELGLQLPR